MIGGQQKGQTKAGGHDYSTAARRRVWASRTQINGLRQRAARGERGSQTHTQEVFQFQGKIIKFVE
jgi:hypothetical protein